MRLLIASALAGMALALAACAGSDEPAAPTGAPKADAEGAHVHGLGINPADRSLHIATHAGLFRAAPGERRATRVGTSAQDTMGFTVVGPDRFLGSGHPDIEGLGRGEPPHLGLIASDTAGERWRTISLRGQADFHVLRTAGPRIYGFNASDGRLLVSDDGGRTWAARTPPGPLLDLAPRPGTPDTILAATEDGLHESRDAGRGWRPLTRGLTGLVVWPGPARLVLVDPAGAVHTSTDGGRQWTQVGDVAGQPAAFTWHGTDLYVALHSNEVKVSADGGRSWRLRAALGRAG